MAKGEIILGKDGKICLANVGKIIIDDGIRRKTVDPTKIKEWAIEWVREKGTFTSWWKNSFDVVKTGWFVDIGGVPHEYSSEVIEDDTINYMKLPKGRVELTGEVVRSNISSNIDNVDSDGFGTRTTLTESANVSVPEIIGIKLSNYDEFYSGNFLIIKAYITFNRSFVSVDSRVFRGRGSNETVVTGTFIQTSSNPEDGEELLFGNKEPVQIRFDLSRIRSLLAENKNAEAEKAWNDLVSEPIIKDWIVASRLEAPNVRRTYTVKYKDLF